MGARLHKWRRKSAHVGVEAVVTPCVPHAPELAVVLRVEAPHDRHREYRVVEPLCSPPQTSAAPPETKAQPAPARRTWRLWRPQHEPIRRTRCPQSQHSPTATTHNSDPMVDARWAQSKLGTKAQGCLNVSMRRLDVTHGSWSARIRQSITMWRRGEELVLCRRSCHI
eukprot:571385-Rhodomonas_salina.1